MADESRYTILAVDDERANLMVLYRVFTPEYRLLTAKTGAEALARARSGAPDIVILDIMLPDISGYDVLRNLKGDENTKEIPVIIATGFSGADEEKRSRDLGADGFVTKPYERESILNCIRGAIKDRYGATAENGRGACG